VLWFFCSGAKNRAARAEASHAQALESVRTELAAQASAAEARGRDAALLRAALAGAEERMAQASASEEELRVHHFKGSSTTLYSAVLAT